ncbi:fibroblast growth factor receptor homolog 1 isoform X2 [Ictalurus punctatus]|uniref:Fibroblast growth factor receptor homolog 1 isoform X2 n=1 Tax=Ictalurus punctatus TaxID=7998 RepID=A0A2D0SUT8_ICTPU|nr:fibroblast growth factor receptor homolog 1 isoform X2 [Ictalurus punctatus]
MCNSTNSNSTSLDSIHYSLIGISVLAILTMLFFGILWFKKYQSLNKTIRHLRQGKSMTAPPQDSTPLSPTSPRSVLVMPPLGNSEETCLQTQKSRQSVRLLWKPSQQSPRVTRTDLNLMQLIKAGREGAFYKARMLRGTCKGHSLVTCKIAKEEPFLLIMEFVSYGTLRSFVQTHHDKLSADPEIQNLFAIASYHIALAMEHLRSKMVVHCDLALRNILVSRFPWEIKVAEFGLARDLTRMRSRRSTRKKHHRERVPLRWYPPEYFRNSYYSFKGDVWAFGIVLWEMQTFGSLPYPNLETSDQVVYHICAGTRNVGPDSCRPEILQIMKDCWVEPYTARPSFTDLVRILESIIENDSDYVDVVDQKSISIAED